jgi:hypothetical protein
MTPILGTLARLASRRTLSLVLVLPLLAWTGYAVALASIALSPAQVAAGGSSTGTVTLDAAPLKGTVTVQLSSNAPRIATVPSSVSFSSLTRQSSRTFSVQTTATGCAEIAAFLNGETKRALIEVQPAANPAGAPSLSFSSNPGVAGATITGTVTIVAAPGTYTVLLASSNTAAASVPASVSVTTNNVEGASVGAASFPITTHVNSATICPVISATRAGTTGRKLLTLLPISG